MCLFQTGAVESNLESCSSYLVLMMRLVKLLVLVAPSTFEQLGTDVDKLHY